MKVSSKHSWALLQFILEWRSLFCRWSRSSVCVVLRLRTVRMFKSTIVITYYRSSVVRQSSVRRSSLTFNNLDFFSEAALRYKTKLDRKQERNILYQVYVFRVDLKTKMVAPASLLAESFSTSFLQPLNRLFLDMKKELNVLFFQACVFLADRNARCLPLPLVDWTIVDFFSIAAGQNYTKHYSNKWVNVFYKVCMFGWFWKQR